jgi:hypothetical protein
MFMKRLLIAVYSIGLATALTSVKADDSKETETSAPPAAKAPERKRPVLTEEQKTARKELVAKYDANKDGKLDRDERQSVTAEDRAKARKAGLQTRVRKADAK